MKILYVRAKNYIGIYQGTGLNEIYIDFTKSKNRIILIEGKNGGGKSTLLNMLGPYADPNSSFIPDKEGEKEIAYENNGIVYILNFIHPVTSTGNRGQTKAYIKKKTENGLSEYNPTGNITSFKDILDQEFGLDPSFMELSRMSTEDRGIVDKTPAERIKYVMNIIDNVAIYNNINKVLTKRSSVYKSLVNNIVAKIDSIGEEENLKLTYNSIDKRLNDLYTNKNNIITDISKADAMIKVLDPDLSIQQLYSSIQKELETVNNLIANIEYRMSISTEEKASTDIYIANHSKIVDLISKYENNINNINKSISDMIVSREEESRSIQLKVQRLNSLKSEMDLNDIKSTIKIHENNIIEYERFFKDAKIQNAISISKDEYVTGLHILKDIKEMVDGFKSYSSIQTIIDAIGYIHTNTNLVSVYDNNEEKIRAITSKIDSLNNDHYYYNNLLSKINILNDRPKDCNIDTCPFIKDSLDALASNPKENIDRLEGEVYALNEEKDTIIKENNIITECISAISDIKIIIRNINNNKGILNKLPNGHIFSNQNEFLDRLASGDSFEEIDELYKYIGYANIFEEYKLAKDTLYKLNTDYKIYESKNEVIEELSKDIDEITFKLNNITNKITEGNDNILSYKKSIIELEDSKSNLDKIIDLSKNRDELFINKNELNSKLNAISSNMEKISIYIDIVNKGNNDLINIDNEIKPLEDDKDKIKYGLNLLIDYKKELEKFTESYNLIEVLKTYSSPTKKGIQNLFIRVYMNDTLKLTNDLLSYLFDGRMQLLKYNIGDNGEFSIPCISMHTGMVTDDISSCSRSEKSMISMILGFVLLMQSATVYNVLRLDEIDEGLDTQNRLNYIDNLHRLLDILEVEQCIMVSHSSELSGQVDVIRLEQPRNMITMDNANVIFSL